MASRFSSQGFELYPHPHWPTDAKSTFIDEDESSVLGDKVLDPTSPTLLSAPTMSRKPSMIKNEEAYYSADSMWHEGPHEATALPARHHTQLQVNTQHHPYMRIDPNYAAAYTHPQGWPMSSTSGTSTPTPIFMSPGYGQSQSMGYPGFTPINQQDPTSSEMSPQSSQGGWGSTTSSDSTDHPARRMRSPNHHRAASPMSAMRQDGIRKKNARFEIPQDRNLHNIDSLILATTDESERKELKQQKRLLRNRQAALDSRQRKKTHTEKLEQEKKIWADEKQGLEDNLARAHEHYRQEMMQLRAQYDFHLRELEFQRDEAIRTKTTETADLRRQNNALKEVVRDLENQRKAHEYASSNAAEPNHSHHPSYTPDFNSFDSLGIDDGWDAGSLFGNEDFGKMDHVGPAQQSTPKPTQITKVTVDTPKSDLPFSWNAFYMCLLFGAFIASKSNSSTTSSQLQARIPDLSEDYRAEAGAVLKAVLASTPESAGSLFPSSTRNAPQPSAVNSNLDAMHTTLTTPSRHQELVSAFSLSAESYNHINNPEGLNDHDNDDDTLFNTPTPLERQFATMQRERAEVDRVLNRGGSVERSVVWDRVPEKVLRDFREMVGDLD